MSFAYDIKVELCRQKKKMKSCCELAELYGILLFAGTVQPDEIKIVSEHIYLVAHFVQAAEERAGVVLGIDNKDGSGVYTIHVDQAAERKLFAKIGAKLYPHDGVSLGIDRSVLKKSCCRAAFLRGAFLQCGTASDPEKAYHMEFVSSHKNLAEELMELLNEMELGAKIVRRKNSYVIYMKESERIEDVLNLMGATGSAFRLMDIKVLRDVRNRLNRTVNCETANIAKTATAAVRQMAAIQKIKKSRGLESLDDGLKEVALLRLENPEMTLKELGEMLDPPLSRHGVNHRLRRIMELAENLDNGKKGE